jgi:hypothetical protein
VWAWCIDRIDPEKLEDWIIQMNEPLPSQMRNGKPQPTEAQLQAEGESFMALMAQTKKGG